MLDFERSTWTSLSPAAYVRQETLDDVGIAFREVLDMLYSTKELNVIKLEGKLDDICCLLGLRYYFDDLQVERKKDMGFYIRAIKQIQNINI